MEGNVVSHGDDEKRNMTVALTEAAAVAGTVATTAPPFSARMTTPATASVSLTMPTTTATSSTTAPTGLQAVGRSPCRRRGHPNGGDNSAALQRPHDNDGDGVGVGDIVNHEGNAVDDGTDEERQPFVTFGVAAAVPRMAATTAPPSNALTITTATASVSVTLSTTRGTPSTSAPTRSTSRWSHSTSSPWSPGPRPTNYHAERCGGEAHAEAAPANVKESAPRRAARSASDLPSRTGEMRQGGDS